jgi:hypothetical protein
MKKIHLYCFLAAIFLSVSNHSLAQTSPEKAKPIPSISDDWKYSVTPYAWLPGVSADLPPTNRNSSADISAGDVLRHLDGAVMISSQAHYGRWGILADIAHAELGKHGSRLSDGGVGAGVNSNYSLKLTTYSVGLTYNLVHRPDFYLESITGARHINATVGWDLDLPNILLVDRKGTREAKTLDPILGFKGRKQIAATNWYIPFYMDVGIPGNRTDSTWQAMLGVGKAYSWGDVILGYRVLYYDMKDGEPLQKTNLGGFSLGVGFNF